MPSGALDRFHQEDASNTRRHGGLGLGLAIVRHVAELHGGTVRVESQGKGHGSTLAVALPIRSLSYTGTDGGGPLDDERNARTSGRDVPRKPLVGISALVVDDQQDALDLMARIFARYGASITLAASGPAALEILALKRFDVLVCDVGMPEMSGLELVRRWRAMEAERAVGFTPAIALTAYASNQDRLDALDAGFQSHLSKPVAVADLTRVVLELCGQGDSGAP